MKIRVSYTVDLDNDQVENLLDYAAGLDLPTAATPRLTLAALFREHGTSALSEMEEWAWDSRVVLLDTYQEEA
jgi:hypothetical protein